MTMDNTSNPNDNCTKYLVFNLCGETYSTKLDEISEVIESREIKPMPNMVSHFDGVFNLRGRVVGVVNLEKKFSLKNKDEFKSGASLVFNNDAGIFAVNIDKIIGIFEFNGDIIDTEPSISTEIPLDYLIGVAKHESGLIPVVSLNQMLSEEGLVSFKRSKFSA